MRKRHAIHNEKLSQHLFAHGGYDDWVITTAFYSALHFVQYSMFPHWFKGIPYQTLDHFYLEIFTKKEIKGISKHRCLQNLVEIKMPLVYPHYCWLLQQCMYARYIQYQVSRESAETAIVRANAIKMAASD